MLARDVESEGVYSYARRRAGNVNFGGIISHDLRCGLSSCAPFGAKPRPERTTEAAVFLVRIRKMQNFLPGGPTACAARAADAASTVPLGGVTEEPGQTRAARPVPRRKKATYESGPPRPGGTGLMQTREARGIR